VRLNVTPKRRVFRFLESVARANVYEVLRQKEFELSKLEKEVEALQIRSLLSVACRLLVRRDSRG
jgi:hypothetical protein